MRNQIRQQRWSHFVERKPLAPRTSRTQYEPCKSWSAVEGRMMRALLSTRTRWNQSTERHPSHHSPAETREQILASFLPPSALLSKTAQPCLCHLNSIQPLPYIHESWTPKTHHHLGPIILAFDDRIRRETTPSVQDEDSSAPVTPPAAPPPNFDTSLPLHPPADPPPRPSPLF